MTPQPILPVMNQFKSPFASFSVTADAHAIITIVLLLAFIVWVLYTLVVAYHWFRYGHTSWLAVPALGVHIFVSGIFMVYMISGLQ